MMKKAFSVTFLCILLISILLLPSTAAGRALVQEAKTYGGNGRSKIGVIGHRSPTAPSKTGSSPPSEPTPSRKGYITVRATRSRVSAASCGRTRYYSACLPQRPPSRCTSSHERNCTSLGG